MRKVSTLVENYIVRRTTTMLDDRDRPVRVVTSNSVTPLKPSNRWEPVNKRALCKRFEFRDYEHRDNFISDVLEFEKEHGHRARLLIDDLVVTVEVSTKDMDVITELDKEYAKETDLIYKEVCYT